MILTVSAKQIVTHTYAQCMSCLILNHQANGDFFEPDAQNATDGALYAF